MASQPPHIPTLDPATCPHLVLRIGQKDKAFTCYDCGAQVADEQTVAPGTSIP